MREKVLISWSGGKDGALAVYEILKTGDYEIAALLTTVTQDYNRVSMHGVSRVLLERQAESLGIALETILISKNASDKEYESKMREVLGKYLADGVKSVVFGDIFLEDVRRYREDNLSKIGMRAVFPLWGRDTMELARTFIDLGFKAVVSCIDSNVLDRRFVGRKIDERFLSELPADVDPCGENGEFHTFVYDGPIFGENVTYRTGKVVLREERFYYCDLVPVEDGYLYPLEAKV